MMKKLINKLLKRWRLEIVSISILKKLQDINEQLVKSNTEWMENALNWENIADKRLARITQLESNIDVQKNYIRILSEDRGKLEQTIANNKFLPKTRPNLDLAAKTIVEWNNGKTIATLFKKLMLLIDDSLVITLNKYIQTEIKKRKLKI